MAGDFLTKKQDETEPITPVPAGRVAGEVGVWRAPEDGLQLSPKARKEKRLSEEQRRAAEMEEKLRKLRQK